MFPVKCYPIEFLMYSWYLSDSFQEYGTIRCLSIIVRFTSAIEGKSRQVRRFFIGVCTLAIWLTIVIFILKQCNMLTAISSDLQVQCGKDNVIMTPIKKRTRITIVVGMTCSVFIRFVDYALLLIGWLLVVSANCKPGTLESVAWPTLTPVPESQRHKQIPAGLGDCEIRTARMRGWQTDLFYGIVIGQYAAKPTLNQDNRSYSVIHDNLLNPLFASLVFSLFPLSLSLQGHLHCQQHQSVHLNLPVCRHSSDIRANTAGLLHL